MKIVLTGGGTGGHIYPALNIAEAFLKKHPEAELLFIGSSHGPEGQLAARAGLNFIGIPSGKLGKAISLQNLSSLSKLVFGVGRAYRHLSRFRPDVVISTGGYTSAGVVLAQRMRRGRVMIHEQNAVPGRTNLFLSRIADRVCVTFQDSMPYFPKAKTVFVGMPISQRAITGMDRTQARRELGLDPEAFTLLVSGGSQGARKLNGVVLEALPLLDGVQVLHQVGEKNFEDYKAKVPQGTKLYHPVPYIHEFYRAYRAADLVVCRAGAGTIGDFTAAGKPAVLVPYPFAFADHQRKNARSAEERGAAVVVEESELSAQSFAGLVLELRGDPEKLRLMSAASAELARPDAALKIVEIAEDLAGRGTN